MSDNVVINSIADPLIGKTFEGYHFVSLLGKGAFGSVYRASHPRLNREVAVKYIQTDDPQLGKDTDREINILAKLTHPNVVMIYDAHSFENYRLIMMEWIKGGSLRQWLKQLGGEKLALTVILEGMEKVALALEYVHGEGILHLDLKPENILINPLAGEDVPRFVITDFGIAQFNRTTGGLSSVGGTPLYMSPEHIGFGGARPDRCSDIYSFGIILYELLVGQVPFRAPSLGELFQKHASEPAPRPSEAVPTLLPALDAIVLKALAKSPQDRYQSAGEIAKALREIRLSLDAQTVHSLAGPAFAQLVKDNIATAEPIKPTAVPRPTKVQEHPPEGAFILFVKDPDGVQTSHTLQKDSVIIGRGQDTDVQLLLQAISRHHLKITRDAAGSLFVSDLGSANGTYLNGSRLNPNSLVPWRPNNYLTLQGFTLWTGAQESPALPDSFQPRLAEAAIRQLIDVVQREDQRPRVKVDLSQEVLRLEVGKPQYIQVRVQPQGTPTATYHLRVSPGEGADERWYTLPAAPKVIEAGESKTFDMIINAPEDDSAGDAAYNFVIEVASDNAAIPAAVQVLKVQVARFMRFSISLRPSEVSHNKRKKAEVSILNNGNFTETFYIQVDAPDRLSIKPHESQVEIQPHKERVVRLQFSPTRDAQQEGRLLYAVRVAAKSGSTERANGSYIFRRSFRSLSIPFLTPLIVIALAYVYVYVLHQPVPPALETFVQTIETFLQSTFHIQLSHLKGTP